MIEIDHSRHVQKLRSTVRFSFTQSLFCGALAVIGANISGSNLSEPDGLADILETVRIEMELPGLRAAARFSNGDIVRAAVGLADREAQIALDDVAPMPGGSTGKTFVAALTMLLVEDGILSLDALVSEWIEEEPWFNRLPNASDIRLWHLLSHTAGLSDYPETRGYQFQSIWRAIRRGSIQFEPDELIRYTLRKKPLFPVGEGFRYTDIGYLVLGKVIEAATDKQYYDLLREKILDPFGLDQVMVQDRSILPGVVPGYMRGARNLRADGSMKIDPSSEWTGGGVALNPTMLVEFMGALVEDRVVTSDSFKKMREMGWRDPDSPEEYYGLGLFVHEDGAAIGHAGLWPGYRTHVMHFFATGTTVAIQTNRDGEVDTREVVRKVTDFAVKHGTTNE